MEKQKSQFEFIEKKLKEIKQEIRDRKKWRTALFNEYAKVRTFKDHQEKNIMEMISYANIMIRCNEIIAHDYEDMLKELKDVEKQYKKKKINNRKV